MPRTICVRSYTGTRKAALSHLLLWSFFVFFGPELDLFAEESHPGISAESMYSEAVLAFNKKQTAEALSVLDELLKTSPNHVEALELKALTLKTRGEDRKSMEVYNKLIQLKPEKERGPYHFELGVVLNREQKNDEAKKHFEKAVALKFNAVPANLFLGIINFNGGDTATAFKNFEVVKQDGPAEFKVIAGYYMGLIHFKNGYGPGGTSELMLVRARALEVPDSKTAQDIRAAADKILAPFNSVQWFANVAMMAGYDSNISQNPVGTTSPAALSGMSTMKGTVSGGIGRMSSPMDTIQWVMSYRFSYNKNLNPQTTTYEFLSNIPAIYLNYKPMNTTMGGLKIEGNGTFQQSQGVLGPYNLSADIGPFFRHQFDRSNTLQLEAIYRPQTYFTDTGLSGMSLVGRASFRNDTGARFWNPGISLSAEKNSATSATYRYLALGGGVSDMMKLSQVTTVTVSGDVTMTNYSEAGRADMNIVGRISALHNLNRHWNIIADFSYTMNNSNQPDAYTYNKMMASLGLSWAM